MTIIDADGSYPAQEIPRLAGMLNDAEMVVGARTGSGAAIPLVRRPAKWLLTWLASYLTGTKIPDLNSGLGTLDLIGRNMTALESTPPPRTPAAWCWCSR